MKWLRWFALPGLALCLSAAVSPTPTRRAQNFLVHDFRPPSSPPPRPSARDQASFVEIDLDGLALTSVRVKRAVCQALDVSERGWGKIHLVLTVEPEREQDITIVSTFFADGWQYRVAIPERLAEEKLVRSLVQVLLLELANRHAGPKPAEIPLWLSEGISVHLMTAEGPDLVVKSVPAGAMARLVRDVRGLDYLRSARAILRQSAPLTLEELSRPPEDLRSGEPLKRLQSSAHLFFSELARLPGGQARLVQMLRELPSCWNWETAFLRAFDGHFQRVLDVEKWWTVVLLGFTGRDPSQVWPHDQCMEKLDQILLIPAQVRLAADVMPVRIEATLQQAISDWDYPTQKTALNQVLQQLLLLRFNAPPGVVSLIERYRSTIESYLKQRDDALSEGAARRQIAGSAQLLVRETITRLDQLFRDREALRRTAISAGTPAPLPQSPAP